MKLLSPFSYKEHYPKRLKSVTLPDQKEISTSVGLLQVCMAFVGYCRLRPTDVVTKHSTKPFERPKREGGQLRLNCRPQFPTHTALRSLPSYGYMPIRYIGLKL